MSRNNATAETYLNAHATEVSAALAELVESAGEAARSWSLAVAASHGQPETALQHLADAEIRLNHHIRLARTFSLYRVRTAMNRLDAELPDPPIEVPSTQVSS